MAGKIFDIAFELQGKLKSSFGSMFSTANDKMRDLSSNIREQKKQLKDLDKAYERGEIGARQYAKAQATLTSNLEKSERAQKRLSQAMNIQQKAQNLQSASQSMMTGSASVLAGMAVPAYTAMNFESSMADVKKVVDFETPKQFKEMEQDIINLSKRIPMAASGLAQIVAAGGQSGVARNELVKFAEDAAKMGVAFDITADEAGQMMAEWRTAFKLNQNEVTSLADQINYLGNTTAAAAPKISEVVQRIGPLGEVGGLVSGEIAALGASMVAVGTAPEVAATGIKNLILALAKGESATKGQKEAFKALGLDAGKMAKMLQEDAQGAIMTVLKQLQQLDGDKQAATMGKIFGTESLSAIAPLLTNLDTLEQNFNKVGDSALFAGSMQDEFNARSETTENELILLKNNAAAVGITLGNTLLPHIVTLSQKLIEVANKVQAFSEKHPTLTRNLLVGTAAVAGITFGVGALGFAVSSVVLPIATLYTWGTKIGLMSKLAAGATKIWTGAQWLLNTAMSANPISLTIAAISGLIAIAVVLYKKFEPFREMIDGIWEAFKRTFPNAATMISKLAGKVGELWNKFKKFLGFGGDDKPDKKGPGGGSIPKYASGGLISSPHLGLVGEAGPEMIIPLDGSPRAKTLWQKTGEILGLTGRQGKLESSVANLKESSGNQSSGVVINLNYAPVINGGDKDAIKQTLKEDRQNLKDELRNIRLQEKRLSFNG